MRALNTNDLNMAAKIPVVDFASYNSFNGGNIDETNVEIEKLSKEIYDACTTVGFVYIKNHHIPESEISRLFEVAAKFFQLPLEEKNLFARKSVESNHGYVAVGVEKLDESKPEDFKEAFNVTEPFNDDREWPSGECSDFKPSMASFFRTCEQLALGVLDMIALGMKLEDKKLFRKTHVEFGTTDNKTTLRLLNYPAIKELQKGQVRLGEHSDYGTITLLFQDQIGGLEVRSQRGGFVPAVPIEGTILVNIGDLLQRWTNDKLRSTKHRVVAPDDEILRLTPRQSVAFFVHPDNDVIVECLDGSGHYPPITSLEYLNQRLRATYL